MLVKTALKSSNITKIILLLSLVVLMVVGAVPGYLKGHWSWEKPLPVKTISQLIKVRRNGLELPGWQTKNHKEVSISNNKWLYQEVQRDPQTTAILLIHPQQDDNDKPQIQWVDIKGFQHWQTDKEQKIELSVPSTTADGKTVKVQARFFRGWNRQQTFAVIQWYSWYSGGSPDPSSWFWVDQIAQWQGHRIPWIAVSIQIPIEPLGEIEPVLPLAQSLGQTVQSALMFGPLQTKKK